MARGRPDHHPVPLGQHRHRWDLPVELDSSRRVLTRGDPNGGSASRNRSDVPGRDCGSCDTRHHRPEFDTLAGTARDYGCAPVNPRIEMMRALALALVAFVAFPQQPQRDTASITPTRVGTASVSGVVTLGDDSQTPVRRAVVTMLASDGVETRSSVSDDQGRFMIGGLRPGRYTLSALKPAHLTMAYGARRPGRPGTALVITDGQSMRDLRVLLPRGAVLAGRLTMGGGEPLPNVQVVAIPFRLATAGGAAATAAQEFRTDDRGEFRIYGLPPDSYLVAALPAFGR